MVCVDGPQLDEQDPFGVVVPVPVHVPVTEVPVTVYPVVIADLNGSGGAASEFLLSLEHTYDWHHKNECARSAQLLLPGWRPLELPARP